MDIRQLFSDTVRKMKRFDFLTDFVRRKNGEKGRLSDEAAVYRKKTGAATSSILPFISSTRKYPKSIKPWTSAKSR